jgi:leucyl aminopeptidase (aminopeptidase T)
MGISELNAAANVAATNLMGVKAGEEVLVVTERGTSQRIADAVAGACTYLGASASIASYYPQTQREGDAKKVNSAGDYYVRINQIFASTPPPKPLVEAMSSADAVFFCSAKTYPAQVIAETLKKGVRILAGFQLSESAFIRTLLVDQEPIVKVATRLSDELSGNRRITITSESGTNLVFEHMSGRELVYEKYLGLCREPGKMAQVPPGMIATSPREGSGNGTVIVDGAIFGVNRPLDEPLRLQIVNHQIAKVEGGGAVGRALVRELESNDSNSRTFPSEWGIGLNPGSLLGPDIEGETCYGTVHFGVGRNAHVAGGAVESNFHADFMIKAPTIKSDDKILVQSGSFLI